jgi:hypothetical protein
MEVKCMVLSQPLLGGLKETTETSARTVGVPTRTRTGYLPNASLERYYFAILLGGNITTQTDEKEERTVPVAMSE